MADPTIPFAKIWANYPTDPPCVGKDGKPPRGWDNQCAIKVGVALEKSGLSFAAFPGNRCPTGPAHGGMIANAQALAIWLKKPRFQKCSRPQSLTPATWEAQAQQRTGIVFFKDYWRRKGETQGTGSGDHIDLWNRDTLTPTLVSFLRFTLGVSSFPNLNPFTRAPDNENYFSDLTKAAEIWFWDVG